MKALLTTAAVALLLAVPALAQTGSQPQAASSYDRQIQQAYARMAEMPGVDNNERMAQRWVVMVAKANANRSGVSVDIPPTPVMSGGAR